MANIVGTNFDDSLVGTSFSDEIIALGGNDVLLGGDGDDFLDGGFGFDTINGGNGNDTTSYAFYSGPIVANLTTGVVGFPGNSLLTDILISIENVIGTNGNDSITGNNDANVLSGRLGNDSLFGSSGNDKLDGGAGADTANYSALGTTVTLGAFGVLNKGALGVDQLVSIETIVGSSLLGDTVNHSGAVSGGGVTVTGTTTNLSTGVVTVNGSGAPLPLSFNVQQFENVIGSNFNDSITGNNDANVLSGGLGNDTLLGLDGNDVLLGGDGDDFLDGGFGFDTINGGNGNDTTSYAFYSGPIVANLTTGVVGFPGNSLLTDTLISIENVIGTNGNDSITGNNDANVLSGRLGNDSLFGSSGNDKLDGGAGADTANYSALGTTVTLGAFGVLNKGALGVDQLVSIETIVGSSLLGDTVNHSGAVSGGGVTVTGTTTNLSTGVVTVNGSGAPLPLSFNVQQFENVIGSNFNDSITGNNDANVLRGGLGNDTLNGGLGRDTMTGGAGNDIFVYNRTTESPAGSNRDVITDFQRGFDKIDLSAIDANPFNAFLSFNPNDAFTWKGLNGLISGIGQVRYIQSGANLLLQANTDFNFGNFELEIQLNALSSLSSTDVIL
jgi:Ca2+-binding RTX toxin-like protein